MRRERVFERDRNRCAYCGGEFPVEALTVDHVQPRMRGGDRSAGNLVTACGACNTAKAGRRLGEFLREHPEKRAHFVSHVLPHLWPRLRKALEEELGSEGLGARG